MSRLRDAALFLTLGLCWGGTFPAVEVGLTELSPVLLGAIRFDIGALVALGYVLLAVDDPLPRTRADGWAILVGSTLLVSVNVVFLFFGQRFTTGSIASIVYSLNPILTTAFAAVLLSEGSLDARGYLGVLFGVLGVALVANPSPGNVGGDTTIGVALVFVAAVCVSLGGVVTRALEPPAPALTRTAWAMAFGAVQLHLVSLALGEPTPGPAAFTPVILLAIGFMGVFASALAYAIYFTLLDRLGAFETNLVSYVVPVVATVLGAVLLSEPVTILTVSGFVLVVLGFALVKRHALAELLGR
ncbi:DMT family transporter [Halorarum halophilum]|uniref:DMT family transporter n=1 Tax=Halorarum halophilum TaxID=2743090 RepID=A0A7D5GGD2_9EURY|nr:DMT family transporter [Halobaculum halophilum]QLG26711.1 DMT family transporter [Halobaculum halophilum]